MRIRRMRQLAPSSPSQEGAGEPPTRGESASDRRVRAIGGVSYGMYLYHALLVSVMDRLMTRAAIPKHSLLGLACFAVLVVVTWCISAASFRWVEQPFLRLKHRSRAPILMPPSWIRCSAPTHRPRTSRARIPPPLVQR